MTRAQVTVFLNCSLEDEAMATLAEENTAARAMGLTYGQYRALIYQKERGMMAPSLPSKPAKKSRRRYTDEEAFALWQAGKNDCEIGKALGVSRQIIQRWRDTMELPSTAKSDIDTENYRLVRTPAGMFVICEDDL